MPPTPQILIVEDNPSTRDFLRDLLTAEGFEVDTAPNGRMGLERVRSRGTDLVLLNRRLPDMDGLAFCQHIRAEPWGRGLPIIMLTVLSRVDQRLEGFETGADDYVPKPFNSGELLARIKAVLRRTHPSVTNLAEPLWVDGRVQIDWEKDEVIVDGKRTRLGPTECRLLQLLVENAGRPLSFETILSRVWGPAYTDARRLVHVYIRYLRKKLEPDPTQPRYILTQRGVGYRFRVLSSLDPAVVARDGPSSSRAPS